ncbi:BatD family protein [Vibrio sp. FNV 38]|nr:BatD family protein [Vibrio sp. FNV 38]
MNLLFKRVITVILLNLLCFQGAFASEKSTSDTLNEQVSLTSWLSSSNDSTTVSVNEPIYLYIEVATSRWFTAGTQIGDIEVPNLIAPQRDLSATNFNRRKNGNSWSHQRWQIPVYAYKSGQYTIPPIDVAVQFNAPNGQDVNVQFATQPLHFTAQLPSAQLTGQRPSVVSSKASLVQSWGFSNDQHALRVGDSITRKVELQAQNSLAMLLPTLLPSPLDNGAKNYDKPVVLDDHRVRTSYQAKRQEERTYIIQDGGALSLPPIDILWWNTKTQKIEHLSVPGTELQVRHTFTSWWKAYWIYVAALALAGVAFERGCRYWRHYWSNHPTPLIISFLSAIKEQRWAQSRTLIYALLRRNTELVELKNLSSDRQWQRMSSQLQTDEKNSRAVALYCWLQISNKYLRKAAQHLDRLYLSIKKK